MSTNPESKLPLGWIFFLGLAGIWMFLNGIELLELWNAREYTLDPDFNIHFGVRIAGLAIISLAAFLIYMCSRLGWYMVCIICIVIMGHSWLAKEEIFADPQFYINKSFLAFVHCLMMLLYALSTSKHFK